MFFLNWFVGDWKAENKDSFDARLDAAAALLEGADDAAAKKLFKELVTLKGKGQPNPIDLQRAQELEANAYLYADKDLLYGIYLRLRDRSYRLPKSTREDWSNKLKEFFGKDKMLSAQKAEAARKCLSQMSREITFETAEWVRSNGEKARVLLTLTIFAILFVLACVVAIGFSIGNAANCPKDYVSMLYPVAFAGGIGAGISAIRGMGEEKLRAEFRLLLILQLLSRAFLGLFYASVVFTCVWTDLLPVKIPQEKVAFYLAIGFVSGFSDSLFGKAVSRVITGSKGTKGSKDNKGPKEGSEEG
jgi:hypothetical protein